LRKNDILQLPDSLTSCSALERLHLGANALTSIPPGLLEALPNLSELQLYRNKLVAVPAEIGLLEKLATLSVSGNPKMAGLPEEIAKCQSLKELNLSNMKALKAIPAALGLVASLRTLVAAGNAKLKSLPAQLDGLTELRVLDLRLPKKQKCKIPPSVHELLVSTHCAVRGGVPPKAKKGGKKGGKGKKKKK